MRAPRALAIGDLLTPGESDSPRDGLDCGAGEPGRTPGRDAPELPPAGCGVSGLVLGVSPAGAVPRRVILSWRLAQVDGDWLAT